MSNMFAWLSINAGSVIFTVVAAAVTCVIVLFAVKEIRKIKENEIE